MLLDKICRRISDPIYLQLLVPTRGFFSSRYPFSHAKDLSKWFRKIAHWQASTPYFVDLNPTTQIASWRTCILLTDPIALQHYNNNYSKTCGGVGICKTQKRGKHFSWLVSRVDLLERNESFLALRFRFLSSHLSGRRKISFHRSMPPPRIDDGAWRRH